MPAIRYYTVTQEREVKVAAISPLEAAQIGDAAFNATSQEGDEKVTSNIMRSVRVRNLVVRED